MGTARAVVHRRTGSLRWTVIAHVPLDLFDLSILTFLDLYVPLSLPGG